MKPLLLLVDFQEDFLRRSGLRPCAAATVAAAAKLLRHWRETGHPVVHLRLTVSADDGGKLPHWTNPGNLDCIEGSAGHAPPPALKEAPNEPVLHKTGYSTPDLIDCISALGPDAVVVAGLLLHACVRQAVIDLFQNGIPVIVATDAVASDDPLHAAVTRRYLEDRSIPFVPSVSLIESLESGILPGAVSIRTSEVNEAVEGAARFASAWSRTPYQERADLVTSFAARLSEAGEPLARQITAETGKPIRFAKTEILRSVEMAKALLPRLARSAEIVLHPRATTRRRPHGVVAVITPWNNPVYLSLGKILPALLAGNTVVWKPAPEVTALARAILKMLFASGCPPDIVRLVPGDAVTGRTLMAHPGVDAVTITASDAAGFSASEICSGRRIPLQAELGGNNAAIVLADADLEAAATEITAGAFEMAGQRCTANRRVVVERKCLDPLVALLQEKTAALSCGNPLAPDTTIGPLVSVAHRIRVEETVNRAVADGHPAFQAATRAGDGPSSFPPTIIRCDDPIHEIVQEETFGPVLVVQAADHWDEAIARCNGVRQGLAAAIFTKDDTFIDRFLNEARAGILKINASTADAAVDLPFGGWKTSSVGPPEHGDYDLEFYLRPQIVYLSNQP